MPKPASKPKLKIEKPIGRPLTPMNDVEVDKLASIGASNKEIADFFMVDESLINKRFSGLLLKSRSEMKLRLRQVQYKAAIAGSIPMMIWLGKQMLGQREPDISFNGGEGVSAPKAIVVFAADKWDAADDEKLKAYREKIKV